MAEREKYFGFNDCGDVMSQFSVPASQMLTDADVLFAVYHTEAYEGTAFVLFQQHGVLYEVHGSHCSCNGLEDGWQPEATTAAAILMRPGLDIPGTWDSRPEKAQADSLLCALGQFLDPTATAPEVVPLPTWRRAIALAGLR